MKKVFALLLIAILLASACLAEAPSAEEQLRAALDGVLPYEHCFVVDGCALVNLSSDANIAFFGEYILTYRDICQPMVDSGIISDYTLGLLSAPGSTDTIMIYTPKFGDIGFLGDERSGSMQASIINTIDDLAAIFPQLYTSPRMVTNVSARDLAIYNDVWAALTAVPSRSDAVIYAEYAAKYGMSVQDIKDLVFDVMTKILSSD